MKTRWRHLTRALTLLLTFSLFAAACGDDGDDGDSVGGTTPATTAGAPQKGGTITVGQFSASPGLDPAKLAGGGTVGGIEGAAVYDTLMRYNPETAKYEPRTAESMTPNADFSVWTLKLRSGIKFGDGTDYNADAVKFVMDRQMKEGNAAPRSQLSNAIDTYRVVDPLTLEFKLKQGWAGFPYLLTSVNGMIYSPTAFQKVNDPAKFNVEPSDAGAGPFKLKSFKPGEAIELERNPNYWGGEVYLDSMKFVLILGPRATFDAIKTGTLQAGFVRDPAVMAEARDLKYGIVNMPAVAGNMLNLNAGIVITCTGGQPATVCAGQPDGTKVPSKSPTADVRIRRAVAHAVDPKVINQRVYEGKASPNSAPFANFPWDPKVEGPKADVELAKKLVAEVKAEGKWDGRIRVLTGNDPVGVSWGQAVSTQLQAAGFQVSVEDGQDIQGVVRKVLVERDYDITTWAYGLLDESDNNYNQLRSTFASANPRYGYGSAELDAAIDLLRTADTDAKRTEGYKKISEIWVRDVPAHVITEIPQGFVMNPKLNGVIRTGASVVLLDKAWLAK